MRKILYNEEEYTIKKELKINEINYYLVEFINEDKTVDGMILKEENGYIEELENGYEADEVLKAFQKLIFEN